MHVKMRDYVNISILSTPAFSARFHLSILTLQHSPPTRLNTNREVCLLHTAVSMDTDTGHTGQNGHTGVLWIGFSRIC
jgi:hypothetical protein